jgi:hypothetical protein
VPAAWHQSREYESGYAEQMLHGAIFLAILVANEPAAAAADFRILSDRYGNQA